ncbi:MAG TPA: hypothetical protein VIQ48_10665 [Rhodanobacter sp.]|jgi:hypothetical protein
MLMAVVVLGAFMAAKQGHMCRRARKPDAWSLQGAARAEAYAARLETTHDKLDSTATGVHRKTTNDNRFEPIAVYHFCRCHSASTLMRTIPEETMQ